MDKFYEPDNDLLMIFIDFQRAGITASSEIDYGQHLYNLEYKKKKTNLIICCNSNIVCKVRFLDETLKDFEVGCGLKQRDVLFPALFYLALKRVIRDIQEEREMEVLGRTTLLA